MSKNANRDSSEAMVPGAHVHAYCFTHFNYTDEIEKALQECGADYGSYIAEACPTTGRPHLQGYLYWRNKKRGSALIREFPGGNWRVAFGDASSNTVYTTKLDTALAPPVTWGVKPMDSTAKGAAGAEKVKEKYKRILALARAGDFDTLEDEFPYEFYQQKDKMIRHFQDAKVSSVPKEHDGDMPGVWIVGGAGNGKSATARAIALSDYGCDDPYIKPCNNIWWTHYQFQDTVILDDLDPTCQTLSHEFKTWIDRYKTIVRIHHGMLAINPRNFIVTSQYEIADCFDDPEVVAAMTRRFPKVIRMTQEDGDEIRHAKRARLMTAEDYFGVDEDA